MKSNQNNFWGWNVDLKWRRRRWRGHKHKMKQNHMLLVDKYLYLYHYPDDLKPKQYHLSLPESLMVPAVFGPLCCLRTCKGTTLTSVLLSLVHICKKKIWEEINSIKLSSFNHSPSHPFSPILVFLLWINDYIYSYSFSHCVFKYINLQISF